MIIQSDSLEFLKSIKDYENDIIYADPSYALGSEIIGGIKAGFDNWTACELNQDYVNIANARIEYWTKQKNMVNDIKSTSKVNEVVEKGQVNLFDILNEIKKTKQESLF